MTNRERFEKLRPLTPPCVSDAALKERIRRKHSDAKCTRPALTTSQLCQIAGRARSKQMRKTGEKAAWLRGTRA